MAEERDDSQKTEEPTQRQLQQAEERGDVAQSPDIPAWMVLAAAAAIMMMWSGKMANDLRVMMTTFIARPDTISITPQSAGGFVTSVGWELLAILALPFAAFVAVAIAGHVVQHPPVFSVEKLQPDLSRLSPMKGFARLFGMPALVNFVKGILKTIAVAVAVVVTVWPERDTMIGMITLPVALLLPIVQDLMVKILTAALAVLGLIAILDYGWQYYDRMKRLKMTLQEVKDEHRQSEGDPVVKGRLRQIRSERARRRMMAAVPKASVIITNPTHYAVALAYESGKMGAPICVAKGVDHVALKIREIGKEHNVPIIENPPLARALYASVDIDESIKPEHYKAVAQVIGFVMRLKNKVSSARR